MDVRISAKSGISKHGIRRIPDIGNAVTLLSLHLVPTSFICTEWNRSSYLIYQSSGTWSFGATSPQRPCPQGVADSVDVPIRCGNSHIVIITWTSNHKLRWRLAHMVYKAVGMTELCEILHNGSVSFDLSPLVPWVVPIYTSWPSCGSETAQETRRSQHRQLRDSLENYSF